MNNEEKLELAKEQIQKAYINLMEVLSDPEWLNKEYKSDYVDTIHNSSFELLKLKRALD